MYYCKSKPTMKPDLKAKISRFIEGHIQEFHESRLASLVGLKLEAVLLRKNPYLFRAKNINTAAVIVPRLLDAHLSSQEETLFGGFLEKVAIFTCELAYSGRKSAAEGIDLEFNRDGNHYIISVKSGPKWANSQQLARMRDNFKKARKILGGNTRNRNTIAVNGCCYGRDTKPDKGDYLKLCGERFWTLISGDDHLYLDLIEPLGQSAKARNEAFAVEYDKAVNRFTAAFIEHYCLPDGAIAWESIVKLNSAAIKPRKAPAPRKQKRKD